MNSQIYLNRIQFSGAVEPNLKTLCNLQKQHLQHIPFENLDIHYGRPIVLDLDLMYNKIVLHNRGGFCYELNGLFYWLLKETGFNVDMVSARVHTENGNYGEEFDHMALVVSIDKKKYLCDVGFGAFSMEPLEFVLHQELNDDTSVFLFDKLTDGYYRVSHNEGGKWEPDYIFTLIPRKLEDFNAMCHYHQTSSKSHFTRKKVISKHYQNNRLTLSDRQLKITGESKDQIENFEPEAFDSYLKKHFGMEIR